MLTATSGLLETVVEEPGDADMGLTCYYCINDIAKKWETGHEECPMKSLKVSARLTDVGYISVLSVVPGSMSLPLKKIRRLSLLT